VSFHPDRRLLRAAALGALASLVVVLAPALAPALGGAAAAGVALVLLDLVLARREPEVEIARAFPARASLGRACHAEVIVRNRATRRVEVDLYEMVPPDLHPDRLEWHGLRVPPGGEARVALVLQPARRGDRPLGAPLALVRSPLGLLRRRVHGAAGDVVRVYPDTQHLLRPEALDPKRVLAALGVRPARRRGEGMEFESLRDYVPGDDPRRLDWAASARRGRRVVRLYQHERHHALVIALDASRLMAGLAEGRSKLDHAIEAALALAYAGLAAGDRVALAVFDDALRGFLPPRSHRRELGHFIEFLRCVEPRLVEADFEALVRGITLRQRQRALVVVLTDFVEVDASLFMRAFGVLARRHRVLLVAIRDPLYGELDPGSDAPEGAYRRLVLGDLLRERETALTSLRRIGLQTLDLPPARLTAPVLNRYLALRYGSDP
jgi:uncharacterized protein (DUF58 family)